MRKRMEVQVHLAAQITLVDVIIRQQGQLSDPVTTPESTALQRNQRKHHAIGQSSSEPSDWSLGPQRKERDAVVNCSKIGRRSLHMQIRSVGAR